MGQQEGRQRPPRHVSFVSQHSSPSYSPPPMPSPVSDEGRRDDERRPSSSSSRRRRSSSWGPSPYPEPSVPPSQVRPPSRSQSPWQYWPPPTGPTVGAVPIPSLPGRVPEPVPGPYGTPRPAPKKTPAQMPTSLPQGPPPGASFLIPGSGPTLLPGWAGPQPTIPPTMISTPGAAFHSTPFGTPYMGAMNPGWGSGPHRMSPAPATTGGRRPSYSYIQEPQMHLGGQDYEDRRRRSSSGVSQSPYAYGSAQTPHGSMHATYGSTPGPNGDRNRRPSDTFTQTPAYGSTPLYSGDYSRRPSGNLPQTPTPTFSAIDPFQRSSKPGKGKPPVPPHELPTGSHFSSSIPHFVVYPHARRRTVLLTLIKHFALMLYTFFFDAVPRQLYLHFLLRVPSFYFTRVARIFEEAEMTMPEIHKMALEGMDAIALQDMPLTSPAAAKLKTTWENFIDSLVREWTTLNIISGLLVAGILTLLQIESAGADPITRSCSLFSLICVLMSLLYGCVYIIRFAGMRTTYKALVWAREAQKSKTLIWWNVWVLLAMPATWLTWAILLFIAGIMSFVWRSGTAPSEPTLVLSSRAELGLRVGISVVLGLGVVYALLIMETLGQYGSSMDETFKRELAVLTEAKKQERLTGYPSTATMLPLSIPNTFPSAIKMMDLRFRNMTAYDMPEFLSNRKFQVLDWKAFISDIAQAWNVYLTYNVSGLRALLSKPLRPQDRVAEIISKWNRKYFHPRNTKVLLCHEYIDLFPFSPVFAVYLVDTTTPVGQPFILMDHFGPIPEGLSRVDIFDQHGRDATNYVLSRSSIPFAPDRLGNLPIDPPYLTTAFYPPTAYHPEDISPDLVSEFIEPDGRRRHRRRRRRRNSQESPRRSRSRSRSRSSSSSPPPPSIPIVPPTASETGKEPSGASGWSPYPLPPRPVSEPIRGSSPRRPEEADTYLPLDPDPPHHPPPEPITGPESPRRAPVPVPPTPWEGQPPNNNARLPRRPTRARSTSWDTWFPHPRPVPVSEPARAEPQGSRSGFQYTSRPRAPQPEPIVELVHAAPPGIRAASPVLDIPVSSDPRPRSPRMALPLPHELGRPIVMPPLMPQFGEGRATALVVYSDGERPLRFVSYDDSRGRGSEQPRVEAVSHRAESGQGRERSGERQRSRSPSYLRQARQEQEDLHHRDSPASRQQSARTTMPPDLEIPPRGDSLPPISLPPPNEFESSMTPPTAPSGGRPTAARVQSEEESTLEYVSDPGRRHASERQDSGVAGSRGRLRSPQRRMSSPGPASPTLSMIQQESPEPMVSPVESSPERRLRRSAWRSISVSPPRRVTVTDDEGEREDILLSPRVSEPTRMDTIESSAFGRDHVVPERSASQGVLREAESLQTIRIPRSMLREMLDAVRNYQEGGRGRQDIEETRAARESAIERRESQEEPGEGTGREELGSGTRSRDSSVSSESLRRRRLRRLLG